MNNKYKDLKIGDYILIKDGSEWNGKVCIIDSIGDNEAYALCPTCSKPYCINEDTYKFIVKVER
jgi:hypothetical protein